MLKFEITLVRAFIIVMLVILNPDELSKYLTQIYVSE